MTDGAGEDEKVEDSVHESAAGRIENGAGDVADAFGDDPRDGGGGNAVEKGFEGDENAESHQTETDGFEVAMALQSAEGGDGADDGGCPHESEYRPAPHAFMTHRTEHNGRIGTGDEPINRGVVPTAQEFSSGRVKRCAVVECRGNVTRQHSEQVERNAENHPRIAIFDGFPKKHDAHNDGEHDANGVASGVPMFFLWGVGHFSWSVE